MNRIMQGIYGIVGVFAFGLIKSDRNGDSLRDDLDVFYDLMASTGGKDSPHYERYSKLEKEVEKLNMGRSEHAN